MPFVKSALDDMEMLEKRNRIQEYRQFCIIKYIMFLVCYIKKWSAKADHFLTNKMFSILVICS